MQLEKCIYSALRSNGSAETNPEIGEDIATLHILHPQFDLPESLIVSCCRSARDTSKTLPFNPSEAIWFQRDSVRKHYLLVYTSPTSRTSHPYRCSPRRRAE